MFPRGKENDYEMALDACEDADAIIDVMNRYPDTDSVDARHRHDIVSLEDAGLYDVLSQPIADIPDSTVQTGLSCIAQLLLDVGRDQTGLQIVMEAARGESSYSIAKIMKLSPKTVQSRLERIRTNHPDIGDRLYTRKPKKVHRFPGGITASNRSGT